MSKAEVKQVAVTAIDVAPSKPVADERASAKVRELSTEELKLVGGAGSETMKPPHFTPIPLSTTVHVDPH